MGIFSEILPSDPAARQEAEEYLRGLYGVLAVCTTVAVMFMFVIHSGQTLRTNVNISGSLCLVSWLGYLNARQQYRYVPPGWQVLALLFISVAGISYGLHMGGSTTMPTPMAYLLLVLIATLYFGPRAGGLGLALTLIVYGALVYLEHWGYLEYAPLHPVKRGVLDIPGYASGQYFLVAILSISSYILGVYIQRKLRQRREAVEEANAKLVAMDEAKNRFLSVVSHDLRTPITSIKAYAEILDEDAGVINEEDQHKFAQIITQEADRLHRLVTDLLDLDKMEAGKMEWHLEKQDIRPLLENATHVFSAAAKDKAITLERRYPEELPEISVDADRFSQLLANLLSNAIKFTPAGGQVTVAADVGARSTSPPPGLNDGVTISVADTGPGIAEEDVPKLFDRFSQTAAGKKEGGGTGLGLAIAQEIAHAHQGAISVTSTPGRGATFTVVLPAA